MTAGMCIYICWYMYRCVCACVYCMFFLWSHFSFVCTVFCYNVLVYTHCAACRYMHCLRWSRCAAVPQSGVCLCRQRPQGLCRRAATCMDSPPHRRAPSRSEETGHDTTLTYYDTLSPKAKTSATDRLTLLKFTVELCNLIWIIMPLKGS